MASFSFLAGNYSKENSIYLQQQFKNVATLSSGGTLAVIPRNLMKIRTFILFVALFSSYSIMAQKDDESVKFLNDYIKSYTKNKIIYTERIWPSHLDGIKRSLAKDATQLRENASNNKGVVLPEKIVFTEKEMKYVYEEIEKNSNNGWAKNKVVDAQFIARDTIETYMQKKSRFYTYYSFSKPIFLRNNSICIFYFEESDGGSLSTYVKVNGSWTYFARFYSWVS